MPGLQCGFWLFSWFNEAYMKNLTIYKHDLQRIISSAISEYDDTHLYRRDVAKYESVKMQINSLLVDSSWIVDANKNLYLRLYDIFDKNNQRVCSFSLGHMSMLFSKSTFSFREKLLKEKNIQGIVTLKQSVFDHYVLPASIILFGDDNSDIWLTSADSQDQLLDLFIGNFSSDWKIYYTRELSPDNFLPEFYNGDAQLIDQRLQGKEIKELGEIAEVIPGKSARSQNYRKDGIPYLRGRDIQNGKICKAEVCIDAEDAITYSRQLLQSGDILITKHFGKTKMALVSENDIPAIASNMLYIIRPIEVSEKYLYRYLTSKTGSEVFNKQIARIQRGSVVPSVALSDLIHVKVPIFDDVTMHLIDNMDSVSRDGSFETTKNILNNITVETESEIEKQIIDSLVAVGWKKDKFTEDADMPASTNFNSKWKPDIVYRFEDGRKVIIEIVRSLTSLSPDRLSLIMQILQGVDELFVILTTGIYFEIHKSGSNDSLKMINAPTIDDLLAWEKEVR